MLCTRKVHTTQRLVCGVIKCLYLFLVFACADLVQGRDRIFQIR